MNKVNFNDSGYGIINYSENSEIKTNPKKNYETHKNPDGSKVNVFANVKFGRNKGDCIRPKKDPFPRITIQSHKNLIKKNKDLKEKITKITEEKEKKIKILNNTITNKDLEKTYKLHNMRSGWYKFSLIIEKKLNEQLKKAKEENKKFFKEKLNKQEKKLKDDFNQKTNQLQSKITKLEKENIEQNKKITKRDENIIKLEKDKKFFKEKLNEQEKKLTYEFNQKTNQLRSKIIKLEKENTEQDKKITRRDENIIKLEKTNIEQNKKITKQNENIIRLEKTNTEQDKKITKQNKNIIKLTGENTKIREDLNKEISNLKKQYEKRISDLKEKYEKGISDLTTEYIKNTSALQNTIQTIQKIFNDFVIKLEKNKIKKPLPFFEKIKNLFRKSKKVPKEYYPKEVFNEMKETFNKIMKKIEEKKLQNSKNIKENKGEKK